MGDDYTIVDVRAPSEFAAGHVPGALNLPLLADGQRAVVGRTYRDGGPRDARMAALDLVSAELPEYLRSLKVVASRSDRLGVMCWRGGERSRNVVLLLGLIGVRAVQVQGGYKAYRRWVLDGLDGWHPEIPVVTLYGHTGAGKTALLRALRGVRSEHCRPTVLDLEGLALHRGSLLGGLHQPGVRTQKQFDALAWDALRTAAGDYLVVEGEGGKIGHIFLPGTVSELVRGGVPVLVTASAEARAERILREYAPELWTAADEARFRSSLELIGARMPASTLAALSAAFDDGRFYDVVRGLLESYYDPLYQRSSVEGREFASVFETGEDAVGDARRLAACLASVVTSYTGR
ncbi:MAG: tRNA 2-selenouridine(34) synthase MnmH [Thermoleophilia bacterium]